MGQLEEGELGGYQKEIELFELLLTQGNKPIERTKVLKVYFENFNQGAGGTPELSDLLKKVKDAYNSGFLGRLDNIVSSKGINEAIKQLKEN